MSSNDEDELVVPYEHGHTNHDGDTGTPSAQQTSAALSESFCVDPMHLVLHPATADRLDLHNEHAPSSSSNAEDPFSLPLELDLAHYAFHSTGPLDFSFDDNPPTAPASSSGLGLLPVHSEFNNRECQTCTADTGLTAATSVPASSSLLAHSSAFAYTALDSSRQVSHKHA